MKYLILLSFPILFLSACNTSDITAKKNIALVEKYITAVENMNYDIMDSLLADNYTGYGPSYGDSIDKQQALVNWKFNVENLYESINYNKSRNVAVVIPDGPNKGEWISNWGELHIVYKNNIGEVTLWANTTYLIKNGKIVKSYTFYNEADALRQLGYIFVKPEEFN
ncbi:MAG: hypothetical protein GXO47_01555 [Chlorobi bacterium]|nr:hypothetical protein [Chlorobiota bacterium]